jgi:hypothetical protein
LRERIEIWDRAAAPAIVVHALELGAAVRW